MRLRGSISSNDNICVGNKNRFQSILICRCRYKACANSRSNVHDADHARDFTINSSFFWPSSAISLFQCASRCQVDRGRSLRKIPLSSLVRTSAPSTYQPPGENFGSPSKRGICVSPSVRFLRPASTFMALPRCWRRVPRWDCSSHWTRTRVFVWFMFDSLFTCCHLGLLLLIWNVVIVLWTTMPRWSWEMCSCSMRSGRKTSTQWNQVFFGTASRLIADWIVYLRANGSLLIWNLLMLLCITMPMLILGGERISEEVSKHSWVVSFCGGVMNNGWRRPELCFSWHVLCAHHHDDHANDQRDSGLRQTANHPFGTVSSVSTKKPPQSSSIEARTITRISLHFGVVNILCCYHYAHRDDPLRDHGSVMLRNEDYFWRMFEKCALMVVRGSGDACWRVPFVMPHGCWT